MQGLSWNLKKRRSDTAAGCFYQGHNMDPLELEDVIVWGVGGGGGGGGERIASK